MMFNEGQVLYHIAVEGDCPSGVAGDAYVLALHRPLKICVCQGKTERKGGNEYLHLNKEDVC